MRTYRDEGQKAQNVLRVASAGINAQTVVIGADVYELATRDDLAVTAGRIVVDLHAGATVKAKGKLTFTGQPSDAETEVIGGKTYTYQTTLTNVDGHVQIGASAEATIDNLVAAINRTTALAGTSYAAATVKHTTVTAVKSGTDKCIIIAIVGGTAGNAITLVDNATNVARDAATLGTELAGVDPTAGNVVDGLLAAINASATEDIVARKIGTNELQIVAAHVDGDVELACTETLLGANNGWAAAAMFGGTDKKSKRHVVASRVPTAVEVALGNMHFELSFTPTLVFAKVHATTTPGVDKLWDGAITISTTHVTLGNAGSVDWAETDTVELLIFE